MTCWNLLETSETLTFDGLSPLLEEEYDPAQIERFRPHIEQVIERVLLQLSFRERVLEEYRKLGKTLAGNKGLVLRSLSKVFQKHEMQQVYSIIARQEDSVQLKDGNRAREDEDGK